MMASVSHHHQRRTVTVLIVEDEPLQRMHMIDVIENAGYDVVEATNADQAVAILEQCLDIRIILTDIDMPGSMDGLRMAAMIRHRWPPIEIIVISGGKAPDLNMIPARAVFLPKPLNERRVRAALEQFAH